MACIPPYRPVYPSLSLPWQETALAELWHLSHMQYFVGHLGSRFGKVAWAVRIRVRVGVGVRIRVRMSKVAWAVRS